MSVEAQKTRVAGRIWQAIAQSGVDLAVIPQDQVEKLVETITGGVLLEFDAMLDAMTPQADAAGEPGSGTGPEAQIHPAVRLAQAAAASTGSAPSGEQLLWEGRPFLSLRERYVVTDQRVRIITGLVGRDIEDIELIRVRDVDHTQGVGERMMNVGDIQLHSADPSRPNVVLRNVTDPESVHEIIRRAMLEARKRSPFIFEQNM